MRISANVAWRHDSHNKHFVIVTVQSRCNYQVSFDWIEDTVRVSAPGKEIELEWTERFPEDEEACAIVLVGLIEGGAQL